MFFLQPSEAYSISEKTRYTAYNSKTFIDTLESKPIQIIKTLNDNKELLETELKNILE